MEFTFEATDANRRDCVLCGKPVLELKIFGDWIVYDHRCAVHDGVISFRLHIDYCEKEHAQDSQT